MMSNESIIIPGCMSSTYLFYCIRQSPKVGITLSFSGIIKNKNKVTMDPGYKTKKLKRKNTMQNNTNT